MSAIAAAATMLETALKTVPGAETVRDPGATLHTPSLVLGPPSLTWEAMCAGPTSARWLVYAVVDADERAVERLWDLVEATGDAIDASLAVMVRADPTTFSSGGVELPAYELLVEASL